MHIIRVKRKRDLNAPESLYIHESEGTIDNGENAVENLVQGLSVSEIKEPRPRKYCRMLSMTLSEMTEMVVSSPTAFEKQLMVATNVGNDSRDGGKDKRKQDVKFSVTQRKRGRTGLLLHGDDMLEDPLERMGVGYRICDIECTAIHNEGDDGDELSGEDMYDLYVQKSSMDEEEGDDEGQYQVIYLRNDDFFIPEERFDGTDSFDGTEDSNAEGYYGNDYPDDDDNDDWDDSDREYRDDMAFVNLDRRLEEKFGGFMDSSEYGSSDDSY